MPASPRRDSTELTQADPVRKPSKGVYARPSGKRTDPGRLVDFTRHPTAARTAIARLALMRLARASDVAVMTALILACDREGLLWPKPREIAEVTGLALNTVLASLRRLRALGLIDWVRILPTLRGPERAERHQRLPRRDSYRKPVDFGAGKPTHSGCRVLVVRWEKLGVSFQSRDLAQDVLDRSSRDRSRDRSPGIDPSDPLISFGDLKLDCAPAEAGCGTSASPPGSGPESAPPAAADVEPLQSRRGADAAPAPPRTISRPVRLPATPPPLAPRETPRAAIERQGGKGPSGPEPEGEPVTATRMADDLFRMGLLLGPPPKRER
jgi:hypothetical protein